MVIGYLWNSSAHKERVCKYQRFQVKRTAIGRGHKVFMEFLDP